MQCSLAIQSVGVIDLSRQHFQYGDLLDLWAAIDDAKFLHSTYRFLSPSGVSVAVDVSLLSCS